MHQEVIDNNYTSASGFVVLPSEIKRIVAIVPDMTNGMGFLSIYNDVTNEQVLNSVKVDDRNVHINKKMIPCTNYPDGNNFKYSLRMIEGYSDNSKITKLSIILIYEL